MPFPVKPTQNDASIPPLRPLAVTIQTARELTGLGSTTLWKLIAQGKLQTASIGRRRLVLYRSLEELLGTEAALPRGPGRPRNVKATKGPAS